MRTKYLVLLIALFMFTTITGCENGNLDVSKNDRWGMPFMTYVW